MVGLEVEIGEDSTVQGSCSLFGNFKGNAVTLTNPALLPCTKNIEKAAEANRDKDRDGAPGPVALPVCFWRHRPELKREQLIMKIQDEWMN